MADQELRAVARTVARALHAAKPLPVTGSSGSEGTPRDWQWQRDVDTISRALQVEYPNFNMLAFRHICEVGKL